MRNDPTTPLPNDNPGCDQSGLEQAETFNTSEGEESSEELSWTDNHEWNIH